MPSRNIVKKYKENAYYHIYNRGVDKRVIFSDKKDYKKFLGYLKFYLIPTNLQGQTLKVSPSRKLKNYGNDIDLLAYCLMPNHFHLLIHQADSLSIANFMHSLCTKYSIYFNKRNRRLGPLFQGRYRAVEVNSEEQLVYLTKYIHRNPIDILPSRTDLEGYKYSSYGNYLGKFSQSWVKPIEILNLFGNNSYQDFVKESEDRDIKLIEKLTLDIE